MIITLLLYIFSLFTHVIITMLLYICTYQYTVWLTCKFPLQSLHRLKLEQSYLCIRHTKWIEIVLIKIKWMKIILLSISLIYARKKHYTNILFNGPLKHLIWNLQALHHFMWFFRNDEKRHLFVIRDFKIQTLLCLIWTSNKTCPECSSVLFISFIKSQ